MLDPSKQSKRLINLVCQTPAGQLPGRAIQYANLYPYVIYGFNRNLNDYRLYIKSANSLIIIVIVRVDDLISAASNIKLVNSLKFSLCQHFRMKDIGQISYFLGFHFEFSQELCKMIQSKYLERILDRFEMQNFNPKSVPCNISFF